MKRRDVPGLLLWMGVFPVILPHRVWGKSRDGLVVARRVLRRLPEQERVGLDRFRVYRQQGRRLPVWLWERLQLGSPELEYELRKRIQTDLVAERVTRAGGWLLAETEADLAMVLVLARQAPLETVRRR